MKRQRGVVLLMALTLSLLLGLLAAQVLREAQARQWQVSEWLAAARGFEQAEAGLLEGSVWAIEQLPALCRQCLPPPIPPGEPGAPWVAAAGSHLLLQNLGSSNRVKGLAAQQRADLIRVTAISREPRGRQVLEAVYALDDAGAVQRISWRQRLPDG